MFKGIKPPSQPRSLRSIVEQQNKGASFPSPGPVPDLENGSKTYADPGMQAQPSGPGRQGNGADPKPFSLRGS